MNRESVEIALRIIAGLRVHDGPGLDAFVASHLPGWNAPAAGINGAVGPLESMLKERAIRCVLDALECR